MADTMETDAAWLENEDSGDEQEQQQEQEIEQDE